MLQHAMLLQNADLAWVKPPACLLATPAEWHADHTSSCIDLTKKTHAVQTESSTPNTPSLQSLHHSQHSYTTHHSITAVTPIQLITPSLHHSITTAVQLITPVQLIIESLNHLIT